MTIPKNIAASVKQRLLNLARERKEEFQHLLTRYGNERLLVRLAASAHGSTFVVKGATLFTLWLGEPHRATRDLDLLGSGAPTIERLAEMFRAVCATKVEDDGLRFDTESVEASRIREDEAYEGVRIEMLAFLGEARIPLQVDVGFGDAVTPTPLETEFPTILPMSAPKLRAYPRATVIAEKLQAMVALGLANSRMKDFFDVWYLSQNHAFEGSELAAAVKATFERRATPIPSAVPFALTPAFAQDAGKLTQWKAFVSRARPKVMPPGLSDVVAALDLFLGPVLAAARADGRFDAHWSPGGPWSGGDGPTESQK